MQGAATNNGAKLYQQIWRSCMKEDLRRQEGPGSALREAKMLTGFLPRQVSTA